MSKYTIAIIQHPTAVLDLKEGVSRAVEHINEAAKNGARLISFPETWLTGYAAWFFGMAGWDDDHSRYWYGRFLQECPTIDGVELEPIREAARKSKVIVSLGLSEKIRPDSGTAYNSILLIGKQGETLNLHRKLTPTHTEKIIWGQGDASGLNVTNTDVGKIGGLICWEHWNPLIRQAMHFQDEQIHIASWPDMPETHSIAARHYAFEGRCFVASAAQFLTTDDVPSELLEAYRAGLGKIDTDNNILLPGGSGVISPDGSWLSPQVFNKPLIIYAEVDLAKTSEYKNDIDVVGHYSRSDIFQLHVDRSNRSSVIWKKHSE